MKANTIKIILSISILLAILSSSEIEDTTKVFSAPSTTASLTDWETRQAYELTHLNTLDDFRPSVQRAIAGYECHERGITEVAHLPNEPSVEEGDYIIKPKLVALDEANEIISKTISYRLEHEEEGIIYYWLPWDENGYGYGDSWSGASAIHHTGIGLAYILAKYRHLIPNDLERDLNETVGKLDWFGNNELHPYMSYSNIPLSGACGMLLAGDYVEPDPERGLTQAFIDDLHAEGYAWFNRMYDEVKGFGYYEILSSYTGVQHISLPAVYEMAKDASARQQARFMLDELYLHLAHLYQPGNTSGTGYRPRGNLAGFHDRSYGHTVTDRPNAHLMWLLTGEPGGELMVDWWPYTTLVASGYEPPEYVAGIAMKEQGGEYQIAQTFWSEGAPAELLAFEPNLPDLPQWEGTSAGRHLLIPHHTYVVGDGALALGGSPAHVHSSRTGSHNLRISFAKTLPPLSITHIDPLEASDVPTYPLNVAFKFEQPSFRRLFHENTVLSVWDPMPEGFNYTNAFIPLQGVDQVEHRGDWFFVRQGSVFAAYAVIADPQSGVAVETRDGFGKGSGWYKGQFYYVRTPDGDLAAGVGEIASTDDYADFENFIADIESRPLSFDGDSGRLSFVTQDGITLTVQHTPEQYEVDGEIKQREDFYPEYFIHSPWASHRVPTSEGDSFITEVTWGGNRWVYNWKTLNTNQPLHKSVQPDAAGYGETVTYTLSFSGRGQPMTLTDEIPIGLSAPLNVSATVGTPTYTSQTRTIEWTGSPSTDIPINITFPVVVTTRESQWLTNQASLVFGTGAISDSTRLFIEPERVLYLPLVRVNAPYFTGEISDAEKAIFWFGRITPSENHVDVRVGYNEDGLHFNMAIFDRRLWYDPSPSPTELMDWDALALYLDLDGNIGSAPDQNAYRFVAQFTPWGPRDDYQAAYRGDGSGWVATSADFVTDSTYRGEGGPNADADNRGWVLSFGIPFESLGLSGPPAPDDIWGMAVRLHDRDDGEGTPIADKTWPREVNSEQPETWGQLAFQTPIYTHQPTTRTEVVTIREGLGDIIVPDADVGGGSTCGNGLDFWTEWGETNYGDDGDLNIQNQSDVADWPCFSRYYVEFPLDDLPSPRVIISATMTLYQFGNAGGGAWGEPDPSLIQVFTVGEDWDEDTLTWNNAPLASENIASTWVDPLSGYHEPGVPRKWDVSCTVAEAYAAGEPVRLALYSADTAYHSGKYFRSSETTITEGRPTLEVTLGAPMAEVEKSVQPSSSSLGGIVTYTLSLLGNGQSLTVTDDLPPQVSEPGPIQLSVGTAAIYQVSNHRLTWRGALGVNQLMTITFPVTVQVGGPLSVHNTVTVTDAVGNVSTDDALFIVDPLKVYLPVILKTR